LKSGGCNSLLKAREIEVVFFQWVRFYMKRLIFIDNHIMDGVKLVEVGFGVLEISRELVIGMVSFHKCWAESGGMYASMMSWKKIA
jgi:hypothetical protein